MGHLTEEAVRVAPLKLDGYVRVSKVGKRKQAGESFISPEEQREKIEGWAKLRGVTIAHWEEDLDKPGPKLSRPGLDRIMGRIESGATEGIVVARLDRLSRAEVADALKLVARIVDCGGTLAAIDLGIDPTTVFGEFALTLMLALARMESRRKGETWLDSRTRAVDRGVHISGHTPTGYVRDGRKRLHPDPSKSWAVTEAFRMRAAGESWKTIADWLSEEGVATAHGAPMWTIATVRTVIRNRVYLGEARSGDLIKVGAHEPLIDEETWNAANRRRGVRHAPSGSTAGELSGILRCAGCSFALKPKIGKTRHGKSRREYGCRPDKAAGRCPAPASVSARPVEAFVEERFFADYGDIIARFQKRSDERSQAEQGLVGARAELTAALDERLADALGGPESGAYLTTVRARREAIERLEARLAELDDDPSILPNPSTLRELWPDLALQERRALISSAYDGIFLRRSSSPREPAGDRLRFFATGTGPPLPIRGQRGEIRSIDVD